MRVTESAFFFECKGAQLLGVLSSSSPVSDIGLIVLVGGPQYRVGSHRQFVLLARVLANAGYPCLRFDHRGMGDSEGQAHAFDDLDAEIAAATHAFQTRVPKIRRFVLWGLCDAASAILMYRARSRDERIAGMVLLNPWVRSEATLASARVRSYYGNRLLTPEFWRKLLKGRVNPLQSLGEYFSNLRAMGKGNAEAGGFVETMLKGLESFTQPVRIILSSEDLTADEFRVLCERDARWDTACRASNVQIAHVSGADHTFSHRQWRDEVANLTVGCLDAIAKP